MVKSWQAEQKEKKRKKAKSALRFWLVLGSLLLFGGLVVKGYETVKGSVWEGRINVNFTLTSQDISLVSYQPEEEVLVILVFPQGTQIELTHGYGQYRADAIPQFEKQEKRPGLLAESLEENLGVPVEGWIKIVNSKLKIVNSKEMFLSVLKSQIIGRGETNLSQWDLVRLWWQVRKLRYDKTKVIDLGKIGVLLSVTLADQTQVWEVDKASFDDRVGRLFNEPKIREENLGIEVLNGTDHLGLAERGARILTNIGGEVVWVGNSEEVSQKSPASPSEAGRAKVKSQKSKRNSYTVKKILKIFNAEWEEKKEEGRAEVTLTLGEDYWQKLNQK